MPDPICFKHGKTMQCLKTGFTYVDEYGKVFHTDLFYCTKCKTFATNRIFEVDGGPNYEVHYVRGKFTEDFVQSRLKHYHDLSVLDFITKS